jgi:2-dehydro-3-deoxygluconokinase
MSAGALALPSDRVLCVGETMVQVTPVESVRLVDGDLFRLVAGGAESTVALYLSELGHSVDWGSRLGADPLGERVIRQLEEYGVGTSLVRRDPNAPTGVYFKDPAPGRTTVHYYRSQSAAIHMSPTDLEMLLSRHPRLVHVSGVTPALSASCHALVEALLDQAGNYGAEVSFDVNYRPALWSVEQAGPVLLALSRRADTVFVGMDEALQLWGTNTPPEVRELLGSRNRLVVKDGGVGATAFEGERSWFAPAEKVKVVELVGAGDAFAAGVLSGMLSGREMSECLRQGHALAARTLRSTSDFVPAARHPSHGAGIGDLAVGVPAGGEI